MVNAGSASSVDWKNNFEQPFGQSKDMVDSIAFAKRFVNEHPNAHITFIGHSKGGAEAAANAVATNKDAIVFNPATVNLSAYGLSSNTYSANMTTYVVEGEILNKVFGIISTPIDDYKTIKKDSLVGKLLKSTTIGQLYDLIESFFDHSIGTVIKSLEDDR